MLIILEVVIQSAVISCKCIIYIIFFFVLVGRIYSYYSLCGSQKMRGVQQVCKYILGQMYNGIILYKQAHECLNFYITFGIGRVHICIKLYSIFGGVHICIKLCSILGGYIFVLNCILYWEGTYLYQIVFYMGCPIRGRLSTCIYLYGCTTE